MSPQRHPDPHGADPSANEERRRSVRLPASAVPYLSARLVGGPDVRLINISRRGVLVETTTRLLPGSPVGIKFVAADATLILRGCVVRSSVAVLNGSALRYHTAVAFNEDIGLCDASLWEPAEATPTVPSNSPQLPVEQTRPESVPDAEVTLVATLRQNREELQDLLTANEW